MPDKPNQPPSGVTRNDETLQYGVLLICDAHGCVSCVALVRQLQALGVRARVAITPGEALWHLEGHEQAFTTVAIDGDKALADRFELVSYIRQNHPGLRRFMLSTSPAVAELESCTVLDKTQTELILSTLCAKPC